ncbi:MAG: hypothetical protein EBS51_14570 [Planctomycetia bacterium]|nr:hypothetical protein [Planctomycetia bacterium]
MSSWPRCCGSPSPPRETERRSLPKPRRPRRRGETQMNQCMTWRVDAEGVALVTIDVQGRPMNVLTPDFHAQLDATLDQLKADPAVRGAVFTSAKADFMAGADLKWILGSVSSIKTPEQAWAFAAPLNALFRKLETLGKPMVAAINGTALGGGLELALACHYRVAADNPATRLGLPEVLVGLLPGAGGTQRLPRLIGIRDALMLMEQGILKTLSLAVLIPMRQAILQDPLLTYFSTMINLSLEA